MRGSKAVLQMANISEMLKNRDAAGLMKLQPALHRVIPARGSVKSEWILPYDDVRAILDHWGPCPP